MSSFGVLSFTSVVVTSQEVKLQRLILCQFLAGMLLLRPGGMFICKIFDIFTPFTAGLLHILYLNFNDFSIIKPITSRPANSERFLHTSPAHSCMTAIMQVCSVSRVQDRTSSCGRAPVQGVQGHCVYTIELHLRWQVNRLMGQNKDVRELVDFSAVCPKFLEYVSPVHRS